VPFGHDHGGSPELLFRLIAYVKRRIMVSRLEIEKGFVR
jgi:hypothetical protein